MKYHKQLKTCKAITLNDNMNSAEADIKPIVNTLWRSAVLSGLTLGYARLSKMAFGGPSAKLDFTNFRDVGMLVASVAAASATKEYLVKHGFPDVIMQ